MKKVIIWFFFLASLLAADVTIPAGNVSGIWTQANSPYYIDGEITLQLSDNLTIQPGVEVIFNEYYKFIIHGKLLAQGTPADSILFTVADTTGFSNLNATDGSWHGLRFMSCIYNGQGNSKLEHCRIEYAKSSDYNAPYADRCGGGIYINLSSNLEITNCEISNNAACYGGGIYIWESSPILSELTIKRNHARSDGGGILFSGANTDPIIENSLISGNSCSCNGGGIFCSGGSAPILNNTIVNGNSVINGYESGGGGLSCWEAYPTLNNVVIINNSSEQCGGGIESRYDSVINISNGIIADNTANSGGGIFNGAILNLSGVTIRENTAESAGGLYLYGTTVFDPVNRCNIYLNESTQWNGDDIIAAEFLNIDVIVDTFTVLYPNNIYAYPSNNFSFNIQNYKISQIYADLYVDPLGSDENSGLTPDYPMLTISHALSLIAADSLEAHTIHLASGIYSPSLTGETFPIFTHSHISIEGTHQDSVIIDAEDSFSIVTMTGIKNGILRNLTFKNSTQYLIYVNNSNACLDCINIMEQDLPDGFSIILYYSQCIFNRILICNNQYNPSYRIINMMGADLIVKNSTFCNNSVVDEYSFIQGYNSNISLINTIMYNNGNYNCSFTGNDSTAIIVDFCDVENGSNSSHVGGNVQLNWLEHNIDSEPLFCDPENNNYYLQQDSPCIDTGTAFFEWNDEVILDMDEDEYFGNAPDMGALEWYGTPVSDELEIMSYELCNFPNPFNPDTKIQFSIPIDSKVELAVYNIKGQKVKQLVSSQLAAGQHSVVWNGKDESGKQSASGIYFYNVKAEVDGKTKFEKTRKMMLLK